MDQSALLAELETLKEGIRMDAPLVANFFETKTPLLEYSQELYTYQATEVHRKRQVELKEVVRELLAEAFSEEEIEGANINWEADWKINIVDHHGFLNHPILIATNIIGNIHQLPAEKPEGVVVLSDSGIPLNNFFHKRGLKFGGKQLNIFSHKERHVIAYAAPAKPKFPLVERASLQGFSGGEITFLQKVEDQLNATFEKVTGSSYSNQVSRANYDLWPQLFAQDIRSHIPDLMYVSNEALAAALLPRYFEDKENIFTRILFDENVRHTFMETFNNVTGCWDSDGKRGSYFFWGLNEHGEAFSLKVEGNTLISQDAHHSMSIELAPESITQALREKKIFPGMFLVYGIAIFYCGIRPLVGYGSMNYQTRMKEAWVKAMGQVDSSQVALLEHIPTNGFIGGPKATFAATSDGFKELYALDIMATGGLTKEYLERLKGMPFNALLTPALIDIYDSYVKREHRKPITITSSELMGESFAWLRDM